MTRQQIAVYTYIVYRLGNVPMSQTEVGRRLNAKPEMVNMVIRGSKASARLQNGIAVLLGCRSWRELEDTARYFQAAVIDGLDLRRVAR